MLPLSFFIYFTYMLFFNMLPPHLKTNELHSLSEEPPTMAWFSFFFLSLLILTNVFFTLTVPVLRCSNLKARGRDSVVNKNMKGASPVARKRSLRTSETTYSIVVNRAPSRATTKFRDCLVPQRCLNPSFPVSIYYVGKA